MGTSISTANGFKHFNQKLYSTINQTQAGDNIFLSPSSIALAMSMCTIGARHETLNQMLNTLGFTSKEELIKSSEQILRIFNLVDEDRQIQLKLANRLYAQKDYEIQEEFLQIIQKSFSADMKLEDFTNKNEQIVQTINAWVEDQTNQLIKNLLSPSDIQAEIRLILINCIYFKGIWVKQFNERETNHNAKFHEINGTISKISLMYQYGKFAYKENKSLRIQIVHIPYKSNNQHVQFVFTIVLPNESVLLSEIEEKFSSKENFLEDMLDQRNTTSQELLLYIPKFKMEFSCELKNVLEQLGMRNAFDENKADFNDIVKEQDDQFRLFISKVVHKAFIDVNEQGTEAAAATAVLAVTKGIGRRKPQPILFRADRPFLFYIREVRQNLTLFTGKFLTGAN
ncbi:unnamed protein product [Adineta ricciae]|uniref:Serpin domain-containing protein n=1 Tax=Adineta ricciae TaxID=249248 RepID=A0A816DTU5_ADIRI|nr:unnamed protein product [Adineta ricciae]CAF1638162.1 unnamed protein product [Adineta ricciae]